MNIPRVFGAALLVTGTSVGAGMLALPVVTAASGMLPATLILLLCWFIMITTGLLYVELCMHMPAGTNIISMADKYLGSGGKIFTWIVYLFLFYCLTVAYVSGGVEFVQSMTNGELSSVTATIIFVTSFAFVVYKGAKMVGQINMFLMLGLVLSYLCFIFFGFKYIQHKLLLHVQWSKAYLSLPIILLSFGYQHLVPTLSNYLKRDVKALRLAIILGTSLTLVIYFIWEYLILGIVPLDGAHGLLAAQSQGHSAIEPLKHATEIDHIYIVGKFFSFFALTTSFLGVSLGLFDFISDGVKLAKHSNRKILVALLTFLPPTVITFINPNLFLIALDYAGGVGGSLLLVLLPALLVWRARYVKHLRSPSIAFGNRGYLLFIYAFVTVVILISIYQQYLRFIA